MSSTTDRDEAAFLAAARNGARRRFADACGEAGGALARGADPAYLVRRHPLASLVAAGAAGFIAVAALRRRRARDAAPVPRVATPPATKPTRGLLRVLVADLLVPIVLDHLVGSVRATAPALSPTGTGKAI